ncbi:hypothetical protein FJV83_29285 [Mesorhizobium sp. WSM4307]|uniref:hypothetical protein n=1 Tax=unclassified Mesorhizobium TaxID=325217 RepID=UPI00115CDE16|nr:MULTISPECIES: hypothetical protein [unclassified Mesorhizobium]TRC78157.1 hypothetical protein FJV81_11530 [Mesorhizobium sp. WSM4315]TRC79346.1 hypothetical protein FJV83_29285 [Mesorhizobium sp. WSM4307]
MGRVLPRAHGRGAQPRFGWPQNHQPADRPEFGEHQYAREADPAALDATGIQPEPALNQTGFAIGRVRELGADPAVATSIVADHLSFNVIHLKDDGFPIPEFPDEPTPSLRRSLEGLRSGWDDIACRPAVPWYSTPFRTAQIHLQTSAGNDRPDAATDALDIGGNPFMAVAGGSRRGRPRFADPPHDAAPFDATTPPTRQRLSARSIAPTLLAQPIGGD